LVAHIHPHPRGGIRSFRSVDRSKLCDFFAERPLKILISFSKPRNSAVGLTGQPHPPTLLSLPLFPTESTRTPPPSCPARRHHSHPPGSTARCGRATLTRQEEGTGEAGASLRDLWMRWTDGAWGRTTRRRGHLQHPASADHARQSILQRCRLLGTSGMEDSSEERRRNRLPGGDHQTMAVPPPLAPRFTSWTVLRAPASLKQRVLVAGSNSPAWSLTQRPR
jgi:hypothetical protein